MSEELKKFRAQIDTIDDELLKLFNHRAKLAQQIGHAKNGSVVLRPEREAQVLKRMVDANAGPLSAQSVSTLFTEIMSHCRALEEPLSVAFLGPQGTFTEAATIKRFGHACKGVPCASIDEVFRKVESGEASYGGTRKTHRGRDWQHAGSAAAKPA
jgi:chorismate mutase/prephenate dehydratase